MSTEANAEFCYLSVADLARGYANRDFSPVEVTEAFLRRIDALDGVLHSYITVTADAAKSAAKASEQRHLSGAALGPLDGIPFGLKDLYDTAGIRTTASSRQFADRVPSED